MIQQYLQGEGIQAAKKKRFSTALLLDIPIDNSYSLKHIAIEKLDYIYTEGLITTTKYDRILFQEWMYALKIGGYLIINSTAFPNKIKDYICVELLLVGKGKLQKKETVLSSHDEYIVFQKIAPTTIKGDTISAWTFGIITNGNRDDSVIKFIESIQQQKIPSYEIIICGKLGNEKIATAYPHVTYIFFDQQSDKGWITRKKNIICEHATYENLMIVHDRVVLRPDWYEGMKRYGNNFEVLSCICFYQKYVLGWNVFLGTASLTFNPWEYLQVVDKIDFSDWSKKVVTHGGLTIMKKSIWKMYPWDETRFWNQKEDIDLSFKQYSKGIMIRFNPYSELDFTTLRFGLNNVRLKKNKKKDLWFRWDGPFAEKFFLRLYFIKQFFLVLLYLAFRINLFNYNFYDKIKKK